jgi:multiple sugar transport system permease protein
MAANFRAGDRKELGEMVTLDREYRRLGICRVFRKWVGVSFLYVLMILIAITTVGPFILMISASITPKLENILFPFDFLPSPITFANFSFLFRNTAVGHWLFNSFFTASMATLGTVASSALAAYAFARGEFFGKNVIFFVFLGILMVPETAIIVPLFVLVSKLGWVNTYWALIGPWFSSMFGIFFLRQQYLSIPRDYDDAATIDGANRFGIFYKILLPQLTPALVTLAVLRFMGHWNAFLYPFIVTSRANLRTLPVGLATVVMNEIVGGRGDVGGAGVSMAGAVIGFLPTLILFLVAQTYVVQGVALTGIKG